LRPTNYCAILYHGENLGNCIAGVVSLVSTGDSMLNGKRCEKFPRLEKGGEDSLADDVVFHVLPVVHALGFPESGPNGEAQPIPKEEK
jgi:hypothetical protein